MMKAASRANVEVMNGSAATSGATMILPTVIALGRFTATPASGQSLQHQLADGLECVEDSVAPDGNSLEMRCALHPVTARQLSHQILAGVVRVGNNAGLRGIGGLPTRIQSRLQLFYRCRTGKITLIVLDHERQPRQVVPVLGHVVVEILHRLEVRFHALELRIGDEHDAVDVLEDELPAGVVVHLPRNGIKVKARIESANRAVIDGEKIEEQSALGLGG